MGLNIKSCGTGIDVSAGGSGDITTGSITVIDSTMTNTPVGIHSARTSTSSPATAGSIILENIQLSNVSTAVQGPSGSVLAGGTITIAAWGTGHQYTPNGPTSFQGTITANSRPSSLVSNGDYYTQSKPQYTASAASDFVSVRSSGATGDGTTDDTAALQSAINTATSAGQIVWIDAGLYKVTDTIIVPPGAKIVGESYPVIMSSGSNFADMSKPLPVLQVGSSSGQSGQVELSDFIMATQGAQGGAVLIEWNLASPSSAPSGMWDVHTRIGGFEGSDLQVAQCPTSPGSSTVPPGCIAAYMSMHVTASATGLYMENNWLWTADHDIDSSDNTQISIFSGRGLCKALLSTK